MAFPHCLNLDPSATFSLAWRPTRNMTRGTGTTNVTAGTGGRAGGGGATFTVLFEGTPEAAAGWAGWGVSPRGFMPGSDTLVAYGASEFGAPAPGEMGGEADTETGTGAGAGTGVGTGAGARGAARLYHMQGLEPVAVSPPLGQQVGGSVYSDTSSQSDGCSDSSSSASDSGSLFLRVVPSSLAWEILSTDSTQGPGTRVRVLADVTGLRDGPVHVIWRGGPGADVSTGRLSVHRA